MAFAEGGTALPARVVSVRRGKAETVGVMGAALKHKAALFSRALLDSR